MAQKKVTVSPIAPGGAGPGDAASIQFPVSLYIRVSTDRQAKEGDSLEEQESELKKFCDYRNFQIRKIFIERGKSGGNTNRPEYQKLVKDIESGKIKAVVVKKLDRLSRSLLDFEALMLKMQENDVEFMSLRENFDTTTAMGKAMLRVALVFAQLEREQTAERIKDVIAYRASQGLYNGGIPAYGYDNVEKQLVPHKQEKKIIEFIFDTFLHSKSTTVVAKELNAMGSRNRTGSLWDKRQIQKILKRSLYVGLVQLHDQSFEGAHQPLVSKLKFDQVQEVFTEKTFNARSGRSRGFLRGYIRCGDCGQALCPNYTRKKNGKMYYYYRCVSTLNSITHNRLCSRPYLPIEDVHDKVTKTFLEYASEQGLRRIQKDMESHNERIQKEMSLYQAELTRLQNNLALINQKKERYLDSLVTHDFSPSERKKINDKIDEFSLEEKQLEAAIYRQKFDIQERQESLLTIQPFKNVMVKFKLNREVMNEKELKGWLKEAVDTITLFSEKPLKIHFKHLRALQNMP